MSILLRSSFTSRLLFMSRRLFSAAPIPAPIAGSAPERIAGKEVDISRLAMARQMFASKTREEERKILSVLHEVSQYDENTKLSLKIFHLQELSLTSFRDQQLALDSRYVRLRDAVFEEAESLSPSQLVACCVTLRRLGVRESGVWSKLMRGIDGKVHREKGSALSHSQICLALHAMAKNRVNIKKGFLGRMIRHMRKTSGSWNEFDMAWLLYVFRKRRMVPIDLYNVDHQQWVKHLRCLAYHFNEKLTSMQPSSMVVIFHEFSKLNLLPLRSVFRLSNRLKPRLSELTPKNLALLSLALAKLNRMDVVLLKKIANSVVNDPEKSTRISERQLAMMLYAFAKLRVRHQGLVDLVCGKVEKGGVKGEGGKDTKWTDRTVGVLAYALGELGVRREGVWSVLAQRMLQRLPMHPPLHLSNMLMGAGKAGVGLVPEIQNLIEKIDGRVVDKKLISGFSARQIVNLVDGIVLCSGPAFKRAGRQGGVIEEALMEYTRLDESTSRLRACQLSRVFFSIPLEFPEFMRTTPRAVLRMADRYQAPFSEKKEYYFHADLVACVQAIGGEKVVEFAKKGPFQVDVKFEILGKKVGLDLVGEGQMCMSTGRDLGSRLLKLRQLKIASTWKIVGISRKEFLKIPEIDQKRDFLAEKIEKSLGVEVGKLERKPIEKENFNNFLKPKLEKIEYFEEIEEEEEGKTEKKGKEKLKKIEKIENLEDLDLGLEEGKKILKKRTLIPKKYLKEHKKAIKTQPIEKKKDEKEEEDN